MSTIDDVGWIAGQGSVDDLNTHTLLHKPNFASFPSAASFPYNAFMMDDATGTIYKNESGTWVKKLIPGGAGGIFKTLFGGVGNGSDGNVTISVDTDLGSSNTKNYANLTINAGKILHGNSGMSIKVTGDLTFGGGTTASPNFSDDFSGADAWTDADSAKIGVNTTDDRLDFNCVGDNTNDTSYYDIGAGNVSDTASSFRFKIRFSSITAGTAAKIYIGIGAATGNISDTAQDYYGIMISNTDWGIDAQDGGTTDYREPQSLTLQTGVDYFFEVTQLNANKFIAKRYHDSTYTVMIGYSRVVKSSGMATTSKRYLKVSNHKASASGSLVGYINDVKFFNSNTEPTTVSTIHVDGKGAAGGSGANAGHGDGGAGGGYVEVHVGGNVIGNGRIRANGVDGTHGTVTTTQTTGNSGSNGTTNGVAQTGSGGGGASNGGGSGGGSLGTGGVGGGYALGAAGSKLACYYGLKNQLVGGGGGEGNGSSGTPSSSGGGGGGAGSIRFFCGGTCSVIGLEAVGGYGGTTNQSIACSGGGGGGGLIMYSISVDYTIYCIYKGGEGGKAGNGGATGGEGEVLALTF